MTTELANPLYADASEPARVLLGEAGLRAVECPTLQEAVIYVARLGENDKPFARIQTKGGKAYGPLEIERLHKAMPPPPDKMAADTARYEALAREHGADLSEEGFNEALRNLSSIK